MKILCLDGDGAGTLSFPVYLTILIFIGHGTVVLPIETGAGTCLYNERKVEGKESELYVLLT